MIHAPETVGYVSRAPDQRIELSIEPTISKLHDECASITFQAPVQLD
jgi:hypothetical protein